MESYDIDLQKLLGRNTVALNSKSLLKFYTGKNILITGAGGSIGSELVLQILKYQPASLVLLEQSEYNLFTVSQKVNEIVLQNKQELFVKPVLNNLQNEESLSDLLVSNKIDIIFHVAAYKHVPLLESNVAAAIDNNIKSFLTLVNCASFSPTVSLLINVSTDKAFNPEGVMGFTKRINEKILQASLSLTNNKNKSSTFLKGISVRFGNVLGSSGSVVPILLNQIKKGGPLTLTDANAVRYFMLAEEAAGLVLHSGLVGEGGEIFFLDMGDPVRILDLAKALLEQLNLELNKDIDIKYIGLRPGEKLVEEKLYLGSDVKTKHKKIYLTQEEFGSTAINIKKGFIESLQKLLSEVENNKKLDSQTLKAALKQLAYF